MFLILDCQTLNRELNLNGHNENLLIMDEKEVLCVQSEKIIKTVIAQLYHFSNAQCSIEHAIEQDDLLRFVMTPT